MFKILNCIGDEHNLYLVFAAAVICCASAITAIVSFQRSRRAAQGLRLTWLGFTGFFAGSGVWATHFLAMLAYRPALEIHYELVPTIGSLVASIAGVTSGFALAVVGSGKRATWVGGAVAGLGVGAMHYAGMSGVRAQAHMIWDPTFVAFSLAIGAAGFAIALFTVSRPPSWRNRAVGTLFLVLGIVGLHFTGMAAITVLPDPSISLPPDLIERPGLIALVVVMGTLILASACAVLWTERYSSRSALGSLREALNAAPLAVAFFDNAHRLIIWNEGYERFAGAFGVAPTAGLPFSEIVGIALTSPTFVTADSDGPAWLELAAFRGSGRVGQELPLSDGRWFNTEATTTPTGGIVLVATDVTAHRAAQDALARGMARAEAATQAKSNFLANISHEIRTPLNGILGVAQVMQWEQRNEADASRLKLISDCGETLLTVLNDVLDVAKIEAGKMEVRRQPFEVGEAVEASCGAFVALAQGKGLTFQISIDAGAQGLRLGDGGRVRQVLANLASNAVKFTEAGSITLIVSESLSGVRFCMSDTGPGIPQGRLADLCGRFEQLDPSATRRHGGTGLGLALCKELVELMGGELTFESQEGFGSSFSFEIPLPAVGESAGGPALLSGPPPPVATGRCIKILAADDNATNRIILRSLLEPLRVELVTVENGVEAVEALKICPFDLVLMDIRMPQMDGVEATRQIRRFEAEQGTTPVPIVALTANVMEPSRAEYFAAGMDGVVAKPIEAKSLFDTIERHLDASAQVVAA